MDGSEAHDLPHVVLSPHLDDAAFSAWHILSSARDVRVVTVFAGIPRPHLLTALDRARGGASSAEVMRIRRADDRAALALVSRRPVHLDLLDADYVAYDVPALRAAIERDPARFISHVAADPRVVRAPEELQARLDRLLDEAAVVYVPAAIGAHPDHRDVARLGVHLARNGWSVRFYADIPYVLRHGLPGFVGGGDNAAADALVDEALSALTADGPGPLEPTVVELTQRELAAKLLAIHRYRTEFDLVNEDFDGVLTDPQAMRYEVYWRPVGGSTSPAAEAGTFERSG